MSLVFSSPLSYTDTKKDIFYMGFHTDRAGGHQLLFWLGLKETCSDRVPDK